MARTPLPIPLADRLLPAFEHELLRARLHRGRFARILTSLAGANAIVFGRRVFLGVSAERAIAAGAAAAAALLAHELTHVRQYRRYGMAAFLARYVGEYLRARIAGASHPEAYCRISFEREAERASRNC
ncbi:MAG TPA: DUF4157 domain-containing protein [Thermoanaerobaculia bacterium]|nr:DUF4157 domain-containing protein [Thermoanaerobaculia bacterium]